jgi:hypothetical protein
MALPIDRPTTCDERENTKAKARSDSSETDVPERTAGEKHEECSPAVKPSATDGRRLELALK